jgi:xanthine dehydrogenase YagT iron-sulfur-binding subunit
MSETENTARASAEGLERTPLTLAVNGQIRSITVEPRMTLLDALREELALTGTKKACDRGECGACTCVSTGAAFFPT